MHGDSGKEQSIRSSARFNIAMEWDGEVVWFQSASGIGAPRPAACNRGGASAGGAPVKLADRAEIAAVTLQRGIMAANHRFWDWHNAVSAGKNTRHTVTIRMMDEKGSPRASWTLINAYPMKVVKGGMNIKSGEIAVESIQLVYEALRSENVDRAT